MRIFPENLATFEQNNFFHILIWDKVERWRPLSMNSPQKTKKQAGLWKTYFRHMRHSAVEAYTLKSRRKSKHKTRMNKGSYIKDGNIAVGLLLPLDKCSIKKIPCQKTSKNCLCKFFE